MPLISNCNYKVSIITVVFNNVQTLQQTILSVINQSYKNIEYIIVDGGSTDGSLEIIKKYESKIFKWISEPDKGISDAFNKGIALATGDLIGIINADDWYEEQAVETVIKNVTLKEQVYFGNIKLIGRENNLLRIKKSRLHFLSFGMFIMHPTVFVKKEVYQTVGTFNTSLKIAMDFELMLRAKKAGFKFKYIDKEIACMRITGASSDVKKMLIEETFVMRNNLSVLTFCSAILIRRYAPWFNIIKNFLKLSESTSRLL